MVYAGSADQNVKFALLVRDLNLDGTLLTFEEEIHTGVADPESLEPFVVYAAAILGV